MARRHDGRLGNPRCTVAASRGRFVASVLVLASGLMSVPATGSSTSAISSSRTDGVFVWERQADLPDPLGWKGMYAGVSEGWVLLVGGSNFPVPPRDGGRKALSRQILMRPVHAARDQAWTVAEK